MEGGKEKEIINQRKQKAHTTNAHNFFLVDGWGGMCVDCVFGGGGAEEVRKTVKSKPKTCRKKTGLVCETK